MDELFPWPNHLKKAPLIISLEKDDLVIDILFPWEYAKN